MPPSLGIAGYSLGRPPDTVAQRDVLRIALIAAFYLAGLGLMAWVKSPSCRNWRSSSPGVLINFFWLALLRRPIPAAALTLLIVVVVILLSRLKYDNRLDDGEFPRRLDHQYRHRRVPAVGAARPFGQSAAGAALDAARLVVLWCSTVFACWLRTAARRVWSSRSRGLTGWRAAFPQEGWEAFFPAATSPSSRVIQGWRRSPS